MANNFIINTAPRNSACDAIVDLIDAGSAGGTLKIYTGTQPATPATALSGNTLLATLTFSTTAFGASATGTATAATITDDTNSATGSAAWFRIADSNALAIADGSVGTSGADLNFSGGVSFVSGGTVSISSLTVTVPNGA
jgi:hypothetical protein